MTNKTRPSFKSFRLFAHAVKATRHEMWVSVQVLVAFTLVLSFLLYIIEHHAQPDVFSNYWDALLWSFMGYIGDPGEFAAYTPITFWGRVLKVACALVNIAIFAVPAGLVAGGFSDAIAQDKREQEIEGFRTRLLKAFRRRQDPITKFRTVPRYVSPVDVQARQEIDTKDIIDTVRQSDCFRLRNLASAIPADRNPIDRLVIETIPAEGRTSYGCCIDRGSNITIVAPSAATEVAMGNFAYYVALYGGFNYVSKEFEEDTDVPHSYYLVDDNPSESQREYLDDIRRVTRGGWAIVLIVAGSVHPESFHFVTAIQPKLNAGATTIVDTETFRRLFDSLAADMQEQFGLSSDLDQRYLPAGKKNVAMKIGGGKDCNAFTIRVDWAIPAFDRRHIQIACRLAFDVLKAIHPEADTEPHPEWKESGISY